MRGTGLRQGVREDVQIHLLVQVNLILAGERQPGSC